MKFILKSILLILLGTQVCSAQMLDYANENQIQSIKEDKDYLKTERGTSFDDNDISRSRDTFNLTIKRMNPSDSVFLIPQTGDTLTELDKSQDTDLAAVPYQLKLDIRSFNTPYKSLSIFLGSMPIPPPHGMMKTTSFSAVPSLFGIVDSINLKLNPDSTIETEISFNRKHKFSALEFIDDDSTDSKSYIVDLLTRNTETPVDYLKIRAYKMPPTKSIVYLLRDEGHSRKHPNDHHDDFQGFFILKFE
jgi:hypothetical protein